MEELNTVMINDTPFSSKYPTLIGSIFFLQFPKFFFLPPIYDQENKLEKPHFILSSPSVSQQPIEELPPKLQEIIKLFDGVQESKANYEQLLFYGRNLNPLDSQYKMIENKFRAEFRISQVWVRAYLDDC
ncbi:chloroplast sulfur E [Perilla frutescens var. hirtella]|uniref:Chloroplast sulfur E n=1 Tax=Perilla frutescens var. hirtella TaxID=608512 RepID=A0AAD4JFJ0_PERFH|nr:chloroplast sulfur E [Perilla frutescens var. frutescens]KAH6787993.1 chloroplast sulfur E [Perilla frutescens var. hirtella]KAH6832904.1 chloroplast sulfur E [Perilla frutescens var. hirtella]